MYSRARKFGMLAQICPLMIVERGLLGLCGATGR
jgi:hypothetical protein